MSLPAFTPYLQAGSPGYRTLRTQQQVSSWIEAFKTAYPRADGTLLEGVALNAYSANDIAHGLGDALAGWAVVNRQALQEHFSVYQGTTQSITSGVNNTIHFDTADFDLAGAFDITTNWRYTVPRKGLYKFSGRVGVGGAPAGTTVVAAITVAAKPALTKWGNWSATGFDPTPEAMHLVGGVGEPAFQNTWANYGSGYQSAGFYIDCGGRVHLTGFVAGGTVSSTGTIFTLSAGYTPASRHTFDVICSTGGSGGVLGRCDIDSSGNVIAYAGGNTWWSLDSVSFVPSSFTRPTGIESGSSVPETTMQLDAGDLVSMYVYQDSGSSLSSRAQASSTWCQGGPVDYLGSRQDELADPSTYLRLYSSCDRTVDLWVWK